MLSESITLCTVYKDYTLHALPMEMTQTPNSPSSIPGPSPLQRHTTNGGEEAVGFAISLSTSVKWLQHIIDSKQKFIQFTTMIELDDLKHNVSSLLTIV